MTYEKEQEEFTPGKYIKAKVGFARRDRNVVEFGEILDNPDKELERAELKVNPAQNGIVLIGTVAAYDLASKEVTVRQPDGSLIMATNYSGFNMAVDSLVPYMLDERGRFTIIGVNQTENTWGLLGLQLAYEDAATLSDDSVVLIGSTVGGNVAPNTWNAALGTGFVQHISSSGTPLWSMQFGADYGVYPKKCVALSDDRVVIVGVYTDTITFDTTTYTTLGIEEAFVACVDTSGTWFWYDVMPTDSLCEATSIDAFANDSVVFTVKIGNNTFPGNQATFDTVTYTVPALDDNMYVVASISDIGVWNWTTPITAYTGRVDQAHVAVNANQDFYVGGTYRGDDIVLGVGVNYVNLFAPRDCIYVGLYNNAGVAYWVQVSEPPLGGFLGNASANVNDICVDSAGNAILAADFNTPNPAGGQRYYPLGPAGNAYTVANPGIGVDILILKIDDNGVWQWWQNAGGLDVDIPSRIVRMSDDSCTVIGVYGYYPSSAGGAPAYFNVFFPTFTLTPTSTDGNTFLANISSAGLWSWVNTGVNGSTGRLYAITKLSDDDMVVTVSGNGEDYGSVTTVTQQSAVMRVTDTGDWP